ncbi:MAG: hypothetical protein QXX18_07175 [Candidatus Jordarchaeales archaeon]
MLRIGPTWNLKLTIENGKPLGLSSIPTEIASVCVSFGCGVCCGVAVVSVGGVAMGGVAGAARSSNVNESARRKTAIGLFTAPPIP